jgi:hypothetical protein
LAKLALSGLTSRTTASWTPRDRSIWAGQRRSQRLDAGLAATYQLLGLFNQALLGRRELGRQLRRRLVLLGRHCAVGERSERLAERGAQWARLQVLYERRRAHAESHRRQDSNEGDEAGDGSKEKFVDGA